MRAIIYFPSGQVVLHSVREALHGRRCEVVEAAEGANVPELARRVAPDVLILQATPRVAAVLAVAQEVRAASADRPVPMLLIAPDCRAEVTLLAMRAGVNDVLGVTCSEADVTESVARLMKEGPPRGRTPGAPASSDQRLVGGSALLRQIREDIRRVAATDTTVLITGETGTGKELAAELIHQQSRRREKPFASINCAAIPEGLFESELFGYERGAFTGAQAAREGKLQYAEGGTLFLDEIGDMNLYGQAKILRAIETRNVQRLGGTRDIRVNVRVIAATNQNLEQLTSQNRFRQDLYFRLNVARIHLPPLRERVEDIPELIRHSVAELSMRLGRSAPMVTDGVLAQLEGYDWPGNVRELRNVLESALVFSPSRCITDHDLPPYVRALFSSSERRRQTERERIVAALHTSRGNRNETARILGCSRMTLYRKMIKYGLDGGEVEEERNALANA
ncbi:MAG TPA: sigma-54 dependent transcriptional regulator [Thermoanaerobaculia bacterium]|nr:sigma-54 dependent transcriptional regulator [Thermoanaerobaculia bacterium]